MGAPPPNVQLARWDGKKSEHDTGNVLSQYNAQVAVNHYEAAKIASQGSATFIQPFTAWHLTFCTSEGQVFPMYKNLRWFNWHSNCGNCFFNKGYVGPIVLLSVKEQLYFFLSTKYLWWGQMMPVQHVMKIFQAFLVKGPRIAIGTGTHCLDDIYSPTNQPLVLLLTCLYMYDQTADYGCHS